MRLKANYMQVSLKFLPGQLWYSWHDPTFGPEWMFGNTIDPQFVYQHFGFEGKGKNTFQTAS